MTAHVFSSYSNDAHSHSIASKRSSQFQQPASRLERFKGHVTDLGGILMTVRRSSHQLYGTLVTCFLGMGL
jgi:hypothetical protein